MGITIGGKDWDELLSEIKGSTQWYSGNGAPDINIGVLNDYYLDVGTGDVFKKTDASTWEYQGNIRGPEGPPVSTHEHQQTSPADTWLITHNLGRFPSITVVDSAGSVVLGEVTYISKDEICVSFTAPFAGRAYLN